MQPWFRAGLIGAAILAVLALAQLLPVGGVFCCLAWPLVYAGIGALAASFLPAPRDAGRAAGYGALAAMLATFIGGLVQAGILATEVTGVSAAEVWSALPPQFVQLYTQAGIDQATFAQYWNATTGFLGGAVCCGAGVLVAAALGAIGGAIYAAAKPQGKAMSHQE